MSALSSTVQYDLKPAAAPARQYRQNIPPSNLTTATAGDVIRLDFPVNRRGTYLNQEMSFLKFRFNNNNGDAGNGLTPDDSAYGLINILTVYSSSNLVEDI